MPTIGARGNAVMPYTKIRANIGPVTPAQWMLTFQNTLIPMQMIETNREPKANSVAYDCYYKERCSGFSLRNVQVNNFLFVKIEYCQKGEEGKAKKTKQNAIGRGKYAQADG